MLLLDAVWLAAGAQRPKAFVKSCLCCRTSCNILVPRMVTYHVHVCQQRAETWLKPAAILSNRMLHQHGCCNRLHPLRRVLRMSLSKHSANCDAGHRQPHHYSSRSSRLVWGCHDVCHRPYCQLGDESNLASLSLRSMYTKHAKIPLHAHKMV